MHFILWVMFATVTPIAVLCVPIDPSYILDFPTVPFPITYSYESSSSSLTSTSTTFTTPSALPGSSATSSPVATVSSTTLSPTYSSSASTSTSVDARLLTDSSGFNLVVSLPPNGVIPPILPPVMLPVPSPQPNTPAGLPSVTTTQFSVGPSPSAVLSTVVLSVTAAPVVVIVTSVLPFPIAPSPTSLSSAMSSISSSTSASLVTTTSSPPTPSSTGSPESTSNSTNLAAQYKPVMATYYPDWASESMLPEQVDFNRFDWVDFAFAVPTPQFNLTWTEDDSASLLTRLVQLAHSAIPPKRVKLSVGGWSGSKYFSTAVSTQANRDTFIRNIMGFVNTYGVDGVDIDWEYPGVQGDPSNAVSPENDTPHFLIFLRQLRQALAPGSLLTAAVSTSPFPIPSSPASENAVKIADFGSVLDYILIMNYDTYGSGSSNPGPNAPLTHSSDCTASPGSGGSTSAQGSIDAWTRAGFPAERILLGVPSYGYVSMSRATTLAEEPSRRRKRSWSEVGREHAMKAKLTKQHNRIVSAMHARGKNTAMFAVLNPGPVIVSSPPPALSPARFYRARRQAASPAPSQDAATTTTTTAAAAASTSTVILQADGESQIQFTDLVRLGALVEAPSSASPSSPSSAQNANSTWVGSGGFTRYWDGCSSTPYLVGSSQGQVVSYDDPASLLLKAQYSRTRGIAGVNMFDIHGDTQSWDLVDALRAGLGLDTSATTTA